MALAPTILQLSLLALIFVVQSTPAVLHSDLDVIKLIQKELGLRHWPGRSPCDSDGISCERRISNGTVVLRITRIVFESQRLRGRISPAIAKFSELEVLSLRNNNLFDEIPHRISNCQKLEVLDLSGNRFSGEIPPGLSSLVRLRTLDLSSNRFTGNLRFLKHFPNLEKLNLADNFFSGKLPVSLRSFRNLRFINVSGNALLDGEVPSMNSNKNDLDRFLSPELTSEEINPKRYRLAENSPSGKQNISPSVAMAPTSKQDAYAPAPAPTASIYKHRKNRKRKIITLVLGFLVGSIAGVISGVIFSMVFKLVMHLIRGHNKDTSLKIFSSIIKKPEDLAFLDKEDGLASLELIGQGGCGKVYKAVLPGSGGKEIAIKKINQPPRNAEELTEEDSKLLTKKMRQIKSEIKTVGQIRHRNLLPLLAHLPRTDCHYLVYEFMKNGSLQDCLQKVSNGERELEWVMRYRIALGVASGLEYLHIIHRIIHRDLKPANILLDDEMEARIADFGLAKAVPEAQTHVTTSNVAGTVGYIAPEYYQTFKFTDKCDVYSFGVVLGVLVMGKLPSDQFFQNTEEISLVKWMRNVMTSEDPHRAIDSKLMGNGYEEQMLLVLKVACFCTLDNPKERPNSKNVRCMLAQVNCLPN